MSYRLTLAFALSSIIPLLLITFVVTRYVFPQVESTAQVTVLVALGLLVACLGFFLSRGVINSVLQTSRVAKTIADGNFSERIELEGEGSELSELARSFNKITAQLELNVKELEASKVQLQTILNEIGTAMVTGLSIDKILQMVVRTAAQTVGAEKGLLAVANPGSESLSIKTITGMDENMAVEPEMKMGEGLIGMVAKQGVPIIMPSVPHGRFGELSEIEAQLSSCVCIPLVCSNNVKGVLCLDSKTNGEPFGQDDLVILNNLAAQIAVALENAELREDAERTYFETVSALALAVESRDKYTRGHSWRLGRYATFIARKMGLSEDETKELEDAANLHDIGKIGVVDSILRREGSLSSEQYEVMKQHPVIGENILKPVASLQKLCPLVRHHHERYDGKGYPDGLKGDQMTLGTHILIAADAVDAMYSDRPYRSSLTVQDVRKQLKAGSGTQFHPEVVKTFLKNLDELLEREQMEVIV